MEMLRGPDHMAIRTASDPSGSISVFMLVVAIQGWRPNLLGPTRGASDRVTLAGLNWLDYTDVGPRPGNLASVSCLSDGG